MSVIICIFKWQNIISLFYLSNMLYHHNYELSQISLSKNK